MKNKILISKSLEISLLKWNILQIRIIWKNIGMFDFVILDIDIALNRYCLGSWNYSGYALRYAIFLCGIYMNTRIPTADASSSI